MAQMHIFSIIGNGNYLLNLKDSAAPNGYSPLLLTNDSDIKMFVELLIEPLYKSSDLLGYAKSLVGMNYPVDMKVLAAALQSAIKQKNIAVFKAVSNDNTPNSTDTWSQIVGAAMVVAAGESSEGKETEEKKVEGSAVSEEKSEVPTEGQATCGDPVSMLSGEEILPLQDFELPGLLPLVWRRIYRSSKVNLNTGLGYGWRHSFSLQLIDCYKAPPKVGPKQSGTYWFELIDEEGTTHHFNKVKRGQTSYQPSAGLALLHDGESRQILIRADGSHWVFTKQSDTWLLTSINNEFGHELKLIYDELKRLISIMITPKRGIMIRYNSDNNISKIVPYLMNEKGILTVQTEILASYQYNDDRSLIAAIDSKGAAERYKYHTGSLLKQRVRASGFSHYFEWIGDGVKAKCCRQWGDDGAYDYHFTFEGNKSTSTDSLGNTEQYFHNEQSLLTCFIDANGNKTEHQYDSQGRKVITLDAMGQQTQFVYDQVGQLIQTIQPDNHITRYVYNAFGRRVATIDALGQQSTHHFNASGLLLSETDADGRMTQYEYNEVGKLIGKVSKEGVHSVYQWSESGELLAEKVGNTLTRFSYDKFGRLNAILDSQGLVTEYQRNEQGLIIKEVSYASENSNGQTATKTEGDDSVHDESTTICYDYDQAGRLTIITNANGDSTHYGYGGLAQPTKKTFEDGSWLNYEYDKERNLIGIERSDEATYNIEYSPTEKPTTLIGFDGRVQTYQYDNNDKLIEVNDADERIIQLKRDALGRITDQHSFVIGKHAQPQFNHHNLYQYDAIGRVTIAHNNDSMVQQQYHANGQVSQSKQGQFTLDSTFNEQGKRSQLTLPDGQKVTYQYNEQGLLSELALLDKLNAQTNLLMLEYDASGLTEKQYLGNGIILSQDYDAQSRLTKQSWLTTSEASQQRIYQYDKQNQLIAVKEFQQNSDDEKQQSTTQHFTYNKISQLVNSCTSQSETAKENNITEHNNAEFYQWHAFGNPKVESTTPENERDTVVENDRLTSFAGIDFSYDKSGNQISSIATGIIQKRSFDGLNQLRKISHNEKQTHYQYDALDRRSAKITETGRTDFIWDGNQLIGEHVNGQYTWYIYLPESFLPVALIKDNQVYYYHLDQLGTPVCLTNQAQDIVWENNTDLFGAENKALVINNDETQTVNLIDNPLRFQGQYFDEESGLHYNRFRYYCPIQRRFIHQDPIGLAGGINHYQYAPNPINWVDPYGLSCKESNGGFIFSVRESLNETFKKSTDWHFSDRANRNKSLPSYDQVIGEGSSWELLSPGQSIYHDDGIGKPELKFINPDGREAVYNGDTLDLVTDPKFIGTYNYVNPEPFPENWYDVAGWRKYTRKGAGHLFLDVLPYFFGGNVRGVN